MVRICKIPDVEALAYIAMKVTVYRLERRKSRCILLKLADYGINAENLRIIFNVNLRHSLKAKNASDFF